MLDALIALDGSILLWIQEFVRNAFLTPILSFYTKLGDAGVLWVVLSVLMLCFKKTRKAGVLGLFALLMSLLITNCTLKPIFERIRPWLTVEGLLNIVEEHDPNSFPSGHTCAAFAAASAWFGYLPKKWMGITGIVMAGVMGFSRLYVGVHFPSDVLAGMLVGLFCGWLVCFVYKKLADRYEVGRR